MEGRSRGNWNTWKCPPFVLHSVLKIAYFLLGALQGIEEGKKYLSSNQKQPLFSGSRQKARK
jgi:hypothetical protein